MFLILKKYYLKTELDVQHEKEIKLNYTSNSEKIGKMWNKQTCHFLMLFTLYRSLFIIHRLPNVISFIYEFI